MLDNVIREAGRRFGDRAALVGPEDDTTTYAELDEQSDRRARWLAAEHGIGDGSVVALLHPSDAEYVVSYAALAKLGAVTAGINPRLTTAERVAIIEHTLPDAVLGSGDLLAGLPPAPRRIEIEPGQRRTTATGSSFPLAPVEPVPEDPDRPVTIVFTSGTTGVPKGAVFRNRQLAAISRIDLGPDWDTTWGTGGPMLVSTQFAHVGFMTKLPWYLRLGSTLHYVAKWRSGDILERVSAARISTLGAVAPQLALLLRSPRLAELDVSCVDAIIAGGAASPPALVAAARDAFGARYSIRYSSTESGGVGLATAFDAPDDEALHTIGRPRPGVEARVIDAEGADVPPDTVGELCLRSPAVFDHYWNDDDATAAALVDGWLRTGDLASIDASGCFRLAGRRNDMYVRGGYNVHPAEVEAVLSEHPDIADVVVAPRPDDVMGEIGVAVAVVAGNDLALDQLRDWAAPRLASWKLPEALITVDELPLTAMQKIDRAAVGTIAAMETAR